jgi:hypothetical protein
MGVKRGLSSKEITQIEGLFENRVLRRTLEPKRRK